MIAIGCLAPVILLVCGALIGQAVDGPTMAMWGGGVGFAVGLVVLGLVGWLTEKLKA